MPTTVGSFGAPATLPDATNIALNTNIGSQIGTAANQKLGLWGATPVIQPATTVDAIGVNGMFNNLCTVSQYILNTSNFNGNVGNTTYTINAIVKALKQAGILTS